MIIFIYTLVYPVIASANFYTLPPLFTSRPLRPEELAQMVPHTTPKAWTIPFVPFPTAKLAPQYQEEFHRGRFYNSPPLYTSRPLSPEELAQMAPHTTPKTWSNNFEETYHGEKRTKYTGTIFHTSPPLYTSRPLRSEELIQMVPHTNPKTRKTPFLLFTTTMKTIETDNEESSTGFSRSTLDRPEEGTDELYSPTLWSFGTFMIRNHTPDSEHHPSQAYLTQSVMDYGHQVKLPEYESSLATDHISDKNSAALKHPDSSSRKGFGDKVTPPESGGFLEKYDVSETKPSTSKMFTSGSEREFVYQVTSMNTTSNVNRDYSLGTNQSLPESLQTMNQFSVSKSDSSFVKDYAFTTNPTIIRNATPVGSPTFDNSSFEQQRESMSHINLTKSDTGGDHEFEANVANAQVSSSMSHKGFSNQFGSSQHDSFSGEYYKGRTKKPMSITTIVTYAEEDSDTFASNLQVVKSSTTKSQNESMSQDRSSSNEFVGEDYAKNETSNTVYQTTPINQLYPTALQKSFLSQFNSLDSNDSTEMRFVNHSEHIERKSAANVLKGEIFRPVVPSNFSQFHIRNTDRPRTLPATQAQRTSESKKQTAKQNVGTLSVNKPENLTASPRLKPTSKSTTYRPYTSASKRGKIKTTNQATTHSPGKKLVKESKNLTADNLSKSIKKPVSEASIHEQQLPFVGSQNQTNSLGPDVFLVEKSGNLAAFSHLKPTNQSVQTDISYQIDPPGADKDQTEDRNDDNWSFKKFGNGALQVSTTNQPTLNFFTPNPSTEFVNGLHYSGAKEEERRINTNKTEEEPGGMLREAFENSAAYPESTEIAVAQSIRPELEDTGHIRSISNQLVDNTVVNIPGIVSRIQQVDQQQVQEYDIYNAVTTTALPDYESSNYNTGNARWYAVPGTSYSTAPQQYDTSDQISNGVISWLAPHTNYNTPKPNVGSRYFWRSSDVTGKFNNFDSDAGNFEVSSARNEIKLIYRPNMPIEVSPKSGSTHYETVKNPDGGKTHKLVLYV